MTFWGADTNQLTAHGGRCTAQAQHLEQIAAQLHTTVVSTDWTGPDAERFRNDAHRLLTGDVAQLVGRLLETGKQLTREAEAQDLASQADGSSAGSADSTGSADRPGLPSTGGPADEPTPFGPDRKRTPFDPPTPYPGYPDDQEVIYHDGQRLPRPDASDPSQWTGEPPYRMYIDPTGMYPPLRHPDDVRELSPAELGANTDPGNPDIPGLPTRKLTPKVSPGVDIFNRQANVDLNQLPFNPQLFDYSDPQVGQRIGDLEVIEKHDDGSITVFNGGQTVRMEPGAPLPGQYDQEVRDIMQKSYTPWNEADGYQALRPFEIRPDGTIVQKTLGGKDVELPPGATPEMIGVGPRDGVQTAAYYPVEEEVYEAPPIPYPMPKTPNPTLPGARR